MAAVPFSAVKERARARVCVCVSVFLECIIKVWQYYCTQQMIAWKRRDFYASNKIFIVTLCTSY